MGASDPAERDLYQGLIKLAAAFVHEARGNPLGVRKNLAGARTLLGDAIGAGRVAGVDVPALLAAIDRRLDGDPPDVSHGATPAWPLAVPRIPGHRPSSRKGQIARGRGAGP